MPIRLLLACLLMLPFVWADEPRLRLGTIAVPPYGFINGAGQLDGAFYQLTNHIAARAGSRYENGLYPTARLYALLQHRQLDLAISSIALDRDMGMVDLGKVWQLQGVILYRKQLAINPRSTADFKRFRIGRLNGTCPILQREGFKLYDLSDYAQGLRMMSIGRLDGLCGELGGLNPALRATPDVGGQFATPYVFLTTEVRLYGNPRLPKPLLNKLAGVVNTLQRDGETQRILGRYVGPGASAPTLSEKRP